MTVNAFLSYIKQKQSNDKTLHTRLRKSLMKCLIQEFDEDFGSTQRGRQILEKHDRLQGRHFPAYKTAKEGAKR